MSDLSEPIRAANPRRAEASAEIAARTGIDEVMIKALVHGFYDRVRQDPLLGPVFASRIKDWAPHLERMCQFWSSVALLTGRYHGRPMQKHLSLAIDAHHFDRWLELFGQTATELCPPAAAAHFLERANRIAQNLEAGAAIKNGVTLVPGQRFFIGGSSA